MSKEIFINLEKEVFIGNVLDIGFDNNGIIYDLCKNIDDNMTIDYINGTQDKNRIEKNYFDSCVVFFSLMEFKTKRSKLKFFKEIAEYIKKDGILYLWDVDKPRYKSLYFKIKVFVPNKKYKEVSVKAVNPIIDASCENTRKLLQSYFNIIDLKCSDNIYYIKAQKKGSFLIGDIISSN